MTKYIDHSDTQPFTRYLDELYEFHQSSRIPHLMTVYQSDVLGVQEDIMSLSPSPSSDAPTTSSSDSEMEPGPNTKCKLCSEMYTIPKVLGCFHTFCQPCLEKHQSSMEKVTCPECFQDTYLTSQGLMGLMPDYAVANIIETLAVDASAIHCTGCKSKETNAMARCFDCANFLCSNCVMAHQFMHCFEGHRVMMLNDHSSTTPADEGRPNKEVYCPRHRTDILRYFCRTCAMPICKECTYMEHSRGHEYHLITDVKDKQISLMKQLIEDTKYRAGNLRGTTKNIEYASNRVQVHYHKAQNDINDTYKFYQAMLEEKKQEAMLELDEIYNNKKTSLVGINKRAQESIDRLYQGCDFIEKLLKYASPTEILLFYNFIDQCFQNLFTNIPDLNDQLSSFDLGFVSNYQAIKAGIRNTFGYVRHGSEMLEPIVPKPQPIARPNGIIPNCPNNSQIFDPDNITKQYSDNSNNSFYFPPPDPNPYEKWSSGMDIFQNGIDVFSTSADPISEITGKLSSTALYPPKSQIKRQKMIYHCKFGEFGVLEGQFTEPSGVAVNAQNDIIVADTNNHRIQIFDKEGRFKFQFGECGKRDGQLLYPNRVAVVKTSGDIIVTERSPTHQIQIYNQYGQFVRKFGANVLQHPRGVTVDNKGRVIIVECKVMRVIIFDQLGNMLKKFGCSQYLEFPNGVVVNDKEEIFISDNRAHCVKVFNYNGEYLRQIGGEGITNYPIGVGINCANEILVADNHNNFNLTIFSQDGQLVSALESKVKHAQCFDVSLMDDGSVVLASKDYRLYTYRYTQAPPMGL